MIHNDAHKTVFSANTALIFYNAEGGETPISDEEKFYVTRNPIIDGVIGAGRPVTRKGLVELCLVVLPGLKDKPEFLPAELLAYCPAGGSGVMAWWTPAKVRQLYFAKATGLPSGPAPCPAMIFVVRAGLLFAWALSVDARPGPTTQLYYPPFFNVFDSGVCMGNMKTPDGVHVGDISRWERIFFGSAFTLESPPTLQGIAGTQLWKKLVNSGKLKFPVKYLKKSGYKVMEVITGRERKS